MNRTVEGVWKDGRIVPAGPQAPTKIVKGMTEEEQGDDPESIERWIAELRAAPPLVMSPEDEADWPSVYNQGYARPIIVDATCDVKK